MQHQLTEYMDARSLDILLLQETRSPLTTQYVVGKYQFILFGNGKAREYAGVGYIIRTDIRS
eukprot:1402777-Alexandrium_andersonii.AAC.1